MSLEQAYVTFLDPSRSQINFETFYVYSFLLRAGYIVSEYNSTIDKARHRTAQRKDVNNKEDEMIWCVLKERLSQPYKRELVQQERQLYEDTKMKMDSICEKITGQTTTHQDELMIADERASHKRMISPEREGEGEEGNKRCRLEEVDELNFLDILKTELECYAYQEAFNKFSYIKRSSKKREGNLRVHFDIFLPKTNIKRSEDLPNYRMVVVKSSDNFPSIQKLESLKRQQIYNLPIVIAIVTESMALNFIMCTF